MSILSSNCDVIDVRKFPSEWRHHKNSNQAAGASCRTIPRQPNTRPTGVNIMSVLNCNDRPQRKQLSDQLDRLDSMLDGLSEALNESVAEASREGVRLAVKEAVIELL